MRRRARLLTAGICALALGALGAGLVAASESPSADGASASKKGGFTPGKISGKWTGTWKNTTFGSEGTIRANVQAKPQNKLLLLADFGGSVFGCSDPPAAPVTLPKRSGENGWSAAGFRFSKPTQAFGLLKVNYNFRTKAFTGQGAAPPCKPTISYTINGKLTPSSFNATVEIDLGSQTATAVLSAKKQ